MVSKPGGLIISECLALSKPLVMTDPIPGQEEHNADFMTKHNYGILAITDRELIAAVEKSFLAKDKIKTLAKRPNPCALILDYFK